jgi:hypothetical protein
MRRTIWLEPRASPLWRAWLAQPASPAAVSAAIATAEIQRLRFNFRSTSSVPAHHRAIQQRLREASFLPLRRQRKA